MPAKPLSTTPPPPLEILSFLLLQIAFIWSCSHLGFNNILHFSPLSTKSTSGPTSITSNGLRSSPTSITSNGLTTQTTTIDQASVETTPVQPLITISLAPTLSYIQHQLASRSANEIRFLCAAIALVLCLYLGVPTKIWRMVKQVISTYWLGVKIVQIRIRAFYLKLTRRNRKQNKASTTRVHFQEKRPDPLQKPAPPPSPENSAPSSPSSPPSSPKVNNNPPPSPQKEKASDANSRPAGEKEFTGPAGPPGTTGKPRYELLKSVYHWNKLGALGKNGEPRRRVRDTKSSVETNKTRSRLAAILRVAKNEKMYDPDRWAAIQATLFYNSAVQGKPVDMQVQEFWEVHLLTGIGNKATEVADITGPRDGWSYCDLCPAGEGENVHAKLTIGHVMPKSGWEGHLVGDGMPADYIAKWHRISAALEKTSPEYAQSMLLDECVFMTPGCAVLCCEGCNKKLELTHWFERKQGRTSKDDVWYFCNLFGLRREIAGVTKAQLSGIPVLCDVIVPAHKAWIKACWEGELRAAQCAWAV